MLEVIDIHRSFSGNPVLNGVSFKLEEGTLAGMIGPSGAGKSVLLKIIGQVSKPNQGEVRYDEQMQAHLGLMFQEGALFDSLNVFDNVAFHLVGGRVPTFILPRREQEQVHAAVDLMLARVGLTKAAYKMPGQLSGGMRRRVSLARAVVSKPKLVLLDDPTAGLDPVASSVIMDLIVELQRDSKPAMLVVSHDLRRLLPVVDRVFALFDGRIIFEGSVPELAKFNHPTLHQFVSCRYDFDVAA
jgi:phospholipid/cholesterol/gamma-HCH transport system ATP-binding protein